MQAQIKGRSEKGREIGHPMEVYTIVCCFPLYAHIVAQPRRFLVTFLCKHAAG